MARRYRRSSRGRDPYWMNARFASKCHECGAVVPKGARAFYYPNGRKLLGDACCGAADRAAGDFEAARFDEAQLSGGY